MPTRAEYKNKFCRWRIFFKPGAASAIQRWKELLKQVLHDGRAKVRLDETSTYRVELVWQEPVSQASAVRIIRLAKRRNPKFAVAGFPQGITEDGNAAASAEEASPGRASAQTNSAASRSKRPAAAIVDDGISDHGDAFLGSRASMPVVSAHS